MNTHLPWLGLCLALLPSMISAQVPQVLLEQDANDLIITYSFPEVRSFEKLYVDVYLESSVPDPVSLELLRFSPEGWDGDTAMPVSSPETRKLIWKDGVTELIGKGKMRGVVEVSRIEYEPNTRGRKHALASVFIPGLGSSMVSTKRKSAHILITFAAYSFMGVGINNYVQGQQEYRAYQEFPTDSKYDRANTLNRQGITLMGIGGAIWLADIGWTFWKGWQNEKAQKDRQFQIQPGLGTIGMSYRF